MTAVFSPCRTWRYTLTRDFVEEQLVASETRVPGIGRVRTDFAALVEKDAQRQRGGARTVAFIGLNPSTADETQDDPTVRRCIGFARSWGYERMVMLNVFAYRSTDPIGLRLVPREEAIGPENDYWIAVEAASANLVVCAWGVHAKLGRRGEYVRDCLRGINVPLHVLGLTKDGHPKHPLYLRGDLEPVLWGVT